MSTVGREEDGGGHSPQGLMKALDSRRGGEASRKPHDCDMKHHGQGI